MLIWKSLVCWSVLFLWFDLAGAVTAAAGRDITPLGNQARCRDQGLAREKLLWSSLWYLYHSLIIFNPNLCSKVHSWECVWAACKSRWIRSCMLESKKPCVHHVPDGARFWSKSLTSLRTLGISAGPFLDRGPCTVQVAVTFCMSINLIHFKKHSGAHKHESVWLYEVLYFPNTSFSVKIEAAFSPMCKDQSGLILADGSKKKTRLRLGGVHIDIG